MSLPDAISALGPILADPQFRWWALGTLVAIGPVPEEVTKQVIVDGQKTETITTRWRWGGLLRIALIGVLGHSKLAERVGSLETAVEGMTGTMRELIIEFRTHRGVPVALVAPVESAPAARNSSNGSVVAPPSVNGIRCAEPMTVRAVVPSQQLRDS
jgi:hypothetical protein